METEDKTLIQEEMYFEMDFADSDDPNNNTRTDDEANAITEDNDILSDVISQVQSSLHSTSKTIPVSAPSCLQCVEETLTDS